MDGEAEAVANDDCQTQQSVSDEGLMCQLHALAVQQSYSDNEANDTAVSDTSINICVTFNETGDCEPPSEGHSSYQYCSTHDSCCSLSEVKGIDPVSDETADVTRDAAADECFILFDCADESRSQEHTQLTDDKPQMSVTQCNEDSCVHCQTSLTMECHECSQVTTDMSLAADVKCFSVSPLSSQTDCRHANSLQDAFVEFLKKRQRMAQLYRKLRRRAKKKRKRQMRETCRCGKQLKKAKKRRELPDEARIRAFSDQDRMWNLRMKFVRQAKKYFGVPYARKYWTSEDAEYHSPLFLDCCGLLRRVLRDLRHEFGFRVGPWNQSYLFDTLPITVEQEDDMKPGDLVFVSAVYHNAKMKLQKHNLTHVEIWLGDGPKTIGARWHKGKVQVFESYRFNATSYHSPVYIFKSIDTWLMGICRSHCSEHPWRLRSEVFVPGKKSIFALTPRPDDEEPAQHQYDAAAAGDDDDDSEVEEDVSELSVIL